MVRFALLMRGAAPIIWDFRVRRPAHRLYNPWASATRPGRGPRRPHAGARDARDHEQASPRLSGATIRARGGRKAWAAKVAEELRKHGIAE